MSSWTANSSCMTISQNSIFLFLPSSSALSASWRRLPFYHEATCFSACIIKTELLQCGAVWTSVYDTKVSSQCCSPSRRWSWTLGPRDRTDEGAPLVTNQMPYQIQVMSDNACPCDWSMLAIHSWHCPSSVNIIRTDIRAILPDSMADTHEIIHKAQ